MNTTNTIDKKFDTIVSNVHAFIPLKINKIDNLQFNTFDHFVIHVMLCVGRVDFLISAKEILFLFRILVNFTIYSYFHHRFYFIFDKLMKMSLFWTIEQICYVLLLLFRMMK